MNIRRILFGALAAVGSVALASVFYFHRATPPSAAGAAEPAALALAPDTSADMASLKDVLAAYRKIIVLLADEKSLSADEQALANQVGQALFHENRQRVVALEARLEALASSTSVLRF